jgi:hypothetical protein
MSISMLPAADRIYSTDDLGTVVKKLSAKNVSSLEKPYPGIRLARLVSPDGMLTLVEAGSWIGVIAGGTNRTRHWAESCPPDE